MLERVEQLRIELSSIIYNEQFRVFTNVSREARNFKRTKQKLLEEIIYLTNSINMLRELQNEVKYKQILDNLPQMIIVTNDVFQVIYANNWIDRKRNLVGKYLDKIFSGFHELYPKLETLHETGKTQDYIELDYSTDNDILSKLRLSVNLTQDNTYIFSGNMNESVDFENSLVGDYISLCSYCDYVKNIFDGWFEIKNLSELKEKLRISHGICPECYMKEINNLDANSDFFSVFK